MNPLQTSFFGPLALFFLGGAAVGLALVAASNAIQGRRATEHRSAVGVLGSIIIGCAIGLYFATGFCDLITGWTTILVVLLAAIVGGLSGFAAYVHVPGVLPY